MNHTKELIEMAHGGDKAAREKLIVENMGLICYRREPAPSVAVCET